MAEAQDITSEDVASAAPQRRRRPGRPTLSNEELLDTALDLFLEKGFERTSIDAITSAAGMAKRTVYARYGDKTKLFRAALNRAIEEWIVPVERLREAETDDLEQTLNRIGQILVANILSPAGQRLMRLTNAESVRMPEISTFSVRQGTDPTVRYLADLFDRRLGRDGGGMPRSDEAAQAFLNIVVGGPAINAAWGMTLDLEMVDRHTRYCVGLFLNGLLAQQDVRHRPETGRLKALLEEAAGDLDKVRVRLEQANRLAGG